MKAPTNALRLTAMIVIDILLIFILASVVFDIGLRTSWLGSSKLFGGG
jgi:hypothetical protein